MTLAHTLGCQQRDQRDGIQKVFAQLVGGLVSWAPTHTLVEVLHSFNLYKILIK